ncbi:chorismate-binding protein [Flavobacterium chuncheonense]|uniref:Chorismate-binding protein n=1 Tax=Flavobacterium chuncheonense TaxID=2026653 RepID=A0ABW5YJY5_9FLAO
MTELFLKLNTHLKQQLPFVIYSKPIADETIGIFQRNDHLYFVEKYNESGFVFNSFDNSTKAIIPLEFSEVIKELNSIDKTAFISNPIANNYSAAVKSDFEALVAKAVYEIELGSCSKIVVSRKEEVTLTSFDVELSFKKLLHYYPNAFKYCFYHPKIGMWMGATPEQLLKADGNVIHTVALAGTKTKDKLSEEWGEKEKVEQQLVTDFILDNIKKYVSEETVSSPYSYTAGNLVHIKTDISAKLEDESRFKDILEVLHPTPAVCGFPKVLAKDFILGNENYNREFYAGFLGELNYNLDGLATTMSDLFVNLRCMKVEKNIASIFVGCGITAASNPESEFFETVNKSETIKRVI